MRAIKSYNLEPDRDLNEELLNEYYKRIEIFKREAYLFKCRRASISQIRGSLLFNRNPKQSIFYDQEGEEEENIAFEFKRRL